MRLVSDFLELPFLVVQWAHISGLQPPADAVEMIRVVASSPCRITLLAFDLVGLTLDALVHDVVLADGAGIHLNVPSPQSYCRPLLHSETLSGGCFWTFAGLLGFRFAWWFGFSLGCSLFSFHFYFFNNKLLKFYYS